jgi:tripartite motif-containing protein 71
LQKWTVPTSVGGELPCYFALAVDKADKIYTIDACNTQVAVMASQGALVRSWKFNRVQNSNAENMAVDTQGNVFLVFSGASQILKYDATGKQLTFGWNGITDVSNGGTGDGQFWSPGGIALDKQGNIYVADTANGRIQKFDATGRFLAKWGLATPYSQPFIDPLEIAIDSQSKIYFTERRNDELFKLNL